MALREGNATTMSVPLEIVITKPPTICRLPDFRRHQLSAIALGSVWTGAYDRQRPFGLGVDGNGEMSSVKSGCRGKSPDPQRTNGLEPSQFGCRQLFAAFVANQRQTRKNLTRHRGKAAVDQVYFGTE